MLFGCRRMKRCQSGREEELAGKPVLGRGHGRNRSGGLGASAVVVRESRFLVSTAVGNGSAEAPDPG